MGERGKNLGVQRGIWSNRDLSQEVKMGKYEGIEGICMAAWDGR